MDISKFPTLDPELAPLVEFLPDTSTSFDDIAAAREGIALMMPTGVMPGEDSLDIAAAVAPGDVPVRVYRPSGATGDLPGLLYIHGGGFCVGSMELEHAGAVQVASALGVVVVNVDYRLAPEHPYPAGLDDCVAAFAFLAGLEGVDPERLGVHGQSAGGGLAAAVALRVRDGDGGGARLCFQSLGIPEVDDRLDTPSMKAFVDTPFWSRPQAVLSWRHYLGGAPADGYAAPARMGDLSGLPPAYITTMELDPLRDEGIRYAMALMAAGVSVELHSFPGTFHGSAMVTDAAVSVRMAKELLGALRRGLRVSSLTSP